MAELRPCGAVEFLDRLQEVLKGGRRWIRGDYDAGHGARCLVGAIAHVQSKQNICAKEAEAALFKALPPFCRRSLFPTASFELIKFNDRCRSFAGIAKLIARARALAVAAEPAQRAEREAEARRRAEGERAAVRARLLIETMLERERAARAAAGDDRAIYILCPRTPEPEHLAA
jgi:hypothetical protein